MSPLVRVFCVLLLLTALVVHATTMPSASLSNGKILTDDLIRCKVCQRSISHVWHEGSELRQHCRDHGTDPRCDISHMHGFAIEEMVTQVCDALPKTYQAIHESEFDMVLAKDAAHPEAVAERIRATCIKWIHQEHGIEEVAKYLFANLDAGKPTELILEPLVHRYCRNACNPSHKARRHSIHDSEL